MTFSLWLWLEPFKPSVHWPKIISVYTQYVRACPNTITYIHVIVILYYHLKKVKLLEGNDLIYTIKYS